MPFLSRQSPYDVCIIGSGAGGGMTAYMLTKAGANVVVLEAGPLWYSTEDSKMFTWPYQTQRRGASTKEREFGEFDGGLGGFHLEGEPYTTAPGERFDWFRVRMLGGRTNHWGRISLRFGPYDFHRKSLDGLGDDWPITYEDVKPYYDRVDQLIGLYGSNENLPNEPNGIFMPPPKPRCYELMVKKAADKLRVTCIPARLSIITRPLNGRPACHYCVQPTANGFLPGRDNYSLKLWDLTSTFDILPTDFLAFRLEFISRHSNVPYFAEHVAHEDV